MSLPTTVRGMLARFDSPCVVCGALMLAGDPIAGPFGPLARVWVHRDRCLSALYAAQDRPAPVVRDRRDRRAPSTPGPTHAAVNRADAPRCVVCGRRLILGRDGAPVDTDDGHVRHAVCPADRPDALPCGHRSTYRSGPRAGQCRACARAPRGGSV